jgi:hypothetical protein
MRSQVIGKTLKYLKDRYRRRYPHEVDFLERVWPEIAVSYAKLQILNRSGTNRLRFIVFINERGVTTGGGPVLYSDGKALIAKFPSHLRWWTKSDDAEFARTKHNLVELKTRMKLKFGKSLR